MRQNTAEGFGIEGSFEPSRHQLTGARRGQWSESGIESLKRFDATGVRNDHVQIRCDG